MYTTISTLSTVIQLQNPIKILHRGLPFYASLEVPSHTFSLDAMKGIYNKNSSLSICSKKLLRVAYNALMNDTQHRM